MSKLSWRPLFVMILAALALVASACAPAPEQAVENTGNAARSADGETLTDRVKMVFTQANDGTPAVSTTRQPASSDDGREFFGTVEAMNGNVWTVSGQQLTIGAGTELKNNIAVGSQVKVHILPQADGTVLVREIELAQDDDSRDDDSRTGSAAPSTATAGEREFFGTVEAMNGNVWTISGQPVTLHGGTEIKNNVIVGSRVKVHATRQADGTLLVREIEMAGLDDDGSDDSSTSRTGEREFFGTVEAINGNVWTISGQQVAVGTGTEIKNNIAVGSQVKVHTILQADGTLLVREIELSGLDDDDSDDDMDDDRDDDLNDDRSDDWDDDTGDDRDDDSDAGSNDDWDDDSGDDDSNDDWDGDSDDDDDDDDGDD